MFASDLTKYEFQKFKIANRKVTCPICHEAVTLADGFEMVKIKYGRKTTYHFLHTNCLLNHYNIERRKCNEQKL